MKDKLNIFGRLLKSNYFLLPIFCLPLTLVSTLKEPLLEYTEARKKRKAQVYYIKNLPRDQSSCP